jgi:nitrate reductase delta subunit
MSEFLMLARAKKSPTRLEAASRVKAWTRARFDLGDGATIFVSELESAVPGFPPLHTVVAFWTAERKHYHFRVFRPLEDVGEDDIPPSWYRDALAVTPGIDCGCC